MGIVFTVFAYLIRPQSKINNLNDLSLNVTFLKIKFYIRDYKSPFTSHCGLPNLLRSLGGVLLDWMRD